MFHQKYSERNGDAFLLSYLLSLLYLCLFLYGLFTHSHPSSSLFSSVPAVSQFDTGLGGIISNHQRIGPEVWDRICQRWQVNKWHVHLSVWLVFIVTTKSSSAVFLFCAFSTTSRSEESFKQYFSEMPWLAVPYSDEARRSRLNRLYGIQGISQPLLFFKISRWVYSCLWRTGKTATKIGLQPEECGSNVGYQVYGRVCDGIATPLPLHHTLFSWYPPVSCRGLWIKLSGILSLSVSVSLVSPSKNVKNAGRNELMLLPSCTQTFISWWASCLCWFQRTHAMI